MDERTKYILRESPRGTIIVSLDGCGFNAVTLKEFKELYAQSCDYIKTPLTTVIDNYYCLDGYKLIVESAGKQRCINDMLLGDIGPNEKELRLAHNIEKLILNGVYDIETNWK